MAKSSANKHHKPSYYQRLNELLSDVYRYIMPKNKWFRRVILSILISLITALGTLYTIARWYINSQSSQPLTQGVTFVADYARSLGLDAHQTYLALLNDLHIKHLRLVGYWSDIEVTKNHYDFSELDWEFAQANLHHADISLTLGLRQPRWPECHMPSWAQNEPTSEWEAQLNNFITAVVNRYKHNPALRSYQLENEFFLRIYGFYGSCTNFDRSRLVQEFSVVKHLDPNHDIIIARSNNALGWPIHAPTPDKFGISVYKRVWDSTFTHRYAEYPFPAWYYATLAGIQKLTSHRDTVIHELQTEPWPPQGQSITSVSLNEQNKSFDATRFKSRIAYAKATGIRTIYYWGAEYWYYRLTVEHDTSVWNVAKQNFNN